MPQRQSKNQNQNKSQARAASGPNSKDDWAAPLPQANAAERTILGAILMDNNAIFSATNKVSVDDFFSDAHKRLYTGMISLSATQVPINMVTLCDELHKRSQLEFVGGAAYIASLSDGMPGLVNVGHYAKIVRDKALLRSLIYATQAIQLQAFEASDPPLDIIDKALHRLLSMMSEQGNEALPATWAEAVTGAMNEIIGAIQNPGSVMRLNFGIPKLDDMTAGLRREDLVLIVGGTSHGKSTLAQQLAVLADTQNFKGIIFSAEMSKEALAKRELSHTSNVPLYQLRRPELIRNPQAVINDLMFASAKEMKRKLLVIDHDITPSCVWSISEMVHQTQGLDFIIVDYDQLVVREALSRGDNEFAEQARFVADALELAKRLRVCFILLCQPRKMDQDVASGKRAPRIEEIFGSSAVANTAHHVLWIIRRFFQKQMNKEHESEAAVYILKARNDKAGSVEIGFDPDRVIFMNDPLGTIA